MQTKFDIDEEVWFVNNDYEYPEYWDPQHSKIIKSTVHYIQCWKDKDGKILVKYTLNTEKPYTPHSWEFMENRLFKTEKEAKDFRTQKYREYLQGELNKATNVVAEWEEKLKNLNCNG